MSLYRGPSYILRFPPGVDVSALQRISDELVPGVKLYGYVHPRWYGVSRLEAPYVHVGGWELRVPLHGAWLVQEHLTALGMMASSTTPYGVPEAMLEHRTREQLLSEGRDIVARFVAQGWMTEAQATVLTPYQVRGVAWSARRPYTLDIWATGSGKTVEGTLAALTRPGGVFILGPSVCRKSWRTDVPKFTTLDIHRVLPQSERTQKYEGLSAYLKRMRSEGKRPMVVAGMEALGDYVKEVEELEPTTIVFDELQMFASPERWTQVIRPDGSKFYEPKRTKEGELQRNLHHAAVTRWPSVQQRIGLSAQPLDDGRPWRYWAMLDLLDPDGWDNRRNPFEVRYADGHWEKGRWQKTGKSNLGELKARLRWMTHEVTVTEVAEFMPPLRVDVVYLTAADLVRPDAFVDEIRAAEKAARGQDEDSDAYGNLREAKLAQAASMKRPWVFFEALSALRSHQKVVIFLERRALAQRWSQLLTTQVRKLEGPPGQAPIWTLDGDVSDAERDRVLDLYAARTGPTLLVATGQSVGMSKNGMQFSHLAIQAQLPNKPGELVQRRGRFQRLGGFACRYLIPIAQGTYDEVQVQSIGPKIRNIKELSKAEEFDGLDRKLLGVDDLERVRREVLAALGVKVPGT